MQKEVKNRSIMCPVCKRGKLIIASQKADTNKLYTFKTEEAKNADWFVKCPICKSQIGLAAKR